MLIILLLKTRSSVSLCLPVFRPAGQSVTGDHVAVLLS